MRGGGYRSLGGGRRSRVFSYGYSACILYCPAFIIPFDAHAKFETKEKIPEVTDAFSLNIGRKYYADVWDLDVYGEIAWYRKPVLILHGNNDKTSTIRPSTKPL